jgi:hypothetical protein
MLNKITTILLLIDGLTCIAISIFAHTFGIDQNPGWGGARVFMLFAGMVLVLASVVSISKNRATLFLAQILKSEGTKTFFLLAHFWIPIIAIYAWFVTFGNFTTWNHTSQYFSRLANAFEIGHSNINLNPGDALINAIDPYDPKSRAPFPDEVWDMSFYKGKLYYYWGPVPALIIMPFQSLLGIKVTDNYLVLFFSAGLLIFNSLIIVKFWRIFFQHLAIWNMVITIPLIGLILPVIWNTSVPYVYEAAVGAGQFFFMGGIYFAISALERNPAIDAGNLFLTGLFLTCAVGSRAIYAPSIIFLTSIISFWIIKNKPASDRWIRLLTTLGALYVPLAIGALSIGWYNWVRFDSPLEFGLRYQITTYNLNEQVNLIFKPDYFFLNLYAYLFQPFELISKFPFIQPVVFSNVLTTFGIEQPHLYYAGRITGVIFSSPFLALGLIPLFSRRNFLNNKNDGSTFNLYILVIALFTGSFLIEFLSLLFYFTAQTRFLTDIISQITMLAILGYWILISIRQRFHTTGAKILLTVANGLIIFTLCAGFLLAISGETNRMETLNPLLFEKFR